MFGLLLFLFATALADDQADFLAWVEELPPVEPAIDDADGYHLQHQVFGRIATALRQRPHLVEVEQIGQTHQERPIWAFHVAHPTAPVDRKVLVFAGIHALEWISTETALAVLLELVDRPAPGTRATVIPLLNPDGRAKVESDLAEGAIRYRRGNFRNVDLNRDFAVNTEARAVWKGIIPGYYAHSPEPLSQPEARALDALAARECFARAASLHAFGGFFYHPWSGTWDRPEHWGTFVALGRAMEKAQGARAYKTRQLSRWGFFFRAQGSELDHLYGTYGTISFLVELTRSGIRPLRPKTWTNHFRWYNPIDPAPHVEQGHEAMRVLVRHPPVGGEAVPFSCAPPGGPSDAP